MKKINIAELLKDCPKGMELYSPIFGEVYFDKIRPHLAIVVTTDKEQGDFKEEFLYDGRYGMKGECMIFPSKDQRDWSKFHRPFVDGDIVAIDSVGGSQVFIFEEYIEEENDYAHCYMMLDDDGSIDLGCGDFYVERFATEEEKAKLFQAIKDNGYKWNAETKTLEKLVEPKFKAGDRVMRTATHEIHIIDHITSSAYVFKNEGGTGFIFEDEHLYELVPDKFDITTLKPFDKVLVRSCDYQAWTVGMFSFYCEENIHPFACVGGYVSQCIPYEGNEHLLGKTDNCIDFYTTWE